MHGVDEAILPAVPENGMVEQVVAPELRRIVDLAQLDPLLTDPRLGRVVKQVIEKGNLPKGTDIDAQLAPLLATLGSAEFADTIDDFLLDLPPVLNWEALPAALNEEDREAIFDSVGLAIAISERARMQTPIGELAPAQTEALSKKAHLLLSILNVCYSTSGRPIIGDDFFSKKTAQEIVGLIQPLLDPEQFHHFLHAGLTEPTPSQWAESIPSQFSFYNLLWRLSPYVMRVASEIPLEPQKKITGVEFVSSMYAMKWHLKIRERELLQHSEFDEEAIAAAEALSNNVDTLLGYTFSRMGQTVLQLNHRRLNNMSQEPLTTSGDLNSLMRRSLLETFFPAAFRLETQERPLVANFLSHKGSKGELSLSAQIAYGIDKLQRDSRGWLLANAPDALAINEAQLPSVVDTLCRIFGCDPAGVNLSAGEHSLSNLVLTVSSAAEAQGTLRRDTPWPVWAAVATHLLEKPSAALSSASPQVQTGLAELCSVNPELADLDSLVSLIPFVATQLKGDKSAVGEIAIVKSSVPTVADVEKALPHLFVGKQRAFAQGVTDMLHTIAVRASQQARVEIKGLTPKRSKPLPKPVVAIVGKTGSGKSEGFVGEIAQLLDIHMHVVDANQWVPEGFKGLHIGHMAQGMIDDLIHIGYSLSEAYNEIESGRMILFVDEIYRRILDVDRDRNDDFTPPAEDLQAAIRPLTGAEHFYVRPELDAVVTVPLTSQGIMGTLSAPPPIDLGRVPVIFATSLPADAQQKIIAAHLAQAGWWQETDEDAYEALAQMPPSQMHEWLEVIGFSPDNARRVTDVLVSGMPSLTDFINTFSADPRDNAFSGWRMIVDIAAKLGIDPHSISVDGKVAAAVGQYALEEGKGWGSYTRCLQILAVKLPRLLQSRGVNGAVTINASDVLQILHGNH